MLWLPSPPVTRPLALRWLPTVIAVAVLATAGPLGWDKDFGTFLFTLFFYLPVLVILCAGLCIWAVIETPLATRSLGLHGARRSCRVGTNHVFRRVLGQGPRPLLFVVRHPSRFR